MKLSDLKIAIVYDRVNKFGGAERVLLELRKVLGSKLYTLVYEPKKAQWANAFEVKSSFLNFSIIKSRHELLAPVAAFGFENFDFDDFDLVVTITSSDAKAIITKPGTLHVCYCLTPPRYLWEMDSYYLARPGFGVLNSLARQVFGRLMQYMKKSDLIYGQRPDKYIAISKEVQGRIATIYKRPSNVVYPPVDYAFFSKTDSVKKDYFLVVGRLVPYKKTILVVKAFNKLGLPLVVVGDGSEKSRLMRQANSNIEFVGDVDDNKLKEYYSQARALIFPQKEDFGIVPLEAQAAGTPVIAYGKGGALETVADGKTGLFFESQSSGAIMRAVKKFLTMKFDHSVCRNNAKRFDQKFFVKNFENELKNIFIEK